MNPIDEIRHALSSHPHIGFVEERERIVVPSVDGNGFEVALETSEDSFVVHFDAWHEHFDAAEEAVDCFMTGLTNRCRLRIACRGRTPYRWTVELQENGTWVAGSETRLLFFPFWRRASVMYRQNHLISAWRY